MSLEFLKSQFLSNPNSGFSAGEWLFPAELPADLDLERINLADQFFPTYLAVDILPKNAGVLLPGTGD